MEASATSWVFIGGGNMARAILRGGLGRGVLLPESTAVAEPDPAKRESLAALGIATHATAAEAIGWLKSRETDVATGELLLAVKPQSLATVAEELRPRLGDRRRVVVSILAGTPSEKVRRALGEMAAIVRVMPNTPAQVGQGMAAISLGAGARPGDEAAAWNLFRAVGDVVGIDERLMDAFTAVVGSGPAYVFYLAEAMARAAASLGFDEPTSLRIVRQTVAGAAALLAGSEDPPERLRAAVTSQGGTTEAATSVLDESAVADAVARAITAARDRGAQLGGA